MPVTDDEIKEKMPSYIAHILSYTVDESPSGDLTVSSSFHYSKWQYDLVIEKNPKNTFAVAKFYVRGDLLASYESKMKP